MLFSVGVCVCDLLIFLHCPIHTALLPNMTVLFTLPYSHRLLHTAILPYSQVHRRFRRRFRQTAHLAPTLVCIGHRGRRDRLICGACVLYIYIYIYIYIFISILVTVRAKSCQSGKPLTRYMYIYMYTCMYTCMYTYIYIGLTSYYSFCLYRFTPSTRRSARPPTAPPIYMHTCASKSKVVPVSIQVDTGSPSLHIRAVLSVRGRCTFGGVGCCSCRVRVCRCRGCCSLSMCVCV